MKVPTDSEINRLCAEVCGYEVIETHTAYNWRLVYPYGDKGAFYTSEEQAWEEMPKFCTDRNALPELLQKIKESDTDVFDDYVATLINHSDEWHSWKILFDALLMPPRYHAFAALKALDRWPDEWEREPQ